MSTFLLAQRAIIPTAPTTRRLAAIALGIAAMLTLAACANRPEAPIITPLAGPVSAQTTSRLNELLPAEVLLLGEQHDAAQHQQIEQWVIASLAARGMLAAVALEMADAGLSTATLHPSSSEEQTRMALRWNEPGWPWAAYGPAVMTAVRAGVPVIGANLPRAEIRTSTLDARLDTQLPGPALKAQQQLIRQGHCNLLPESQIAPMTRSQIAKDIRMADTVSQAVVPGKVVVLLTGSGHANRALGVPQHLPAGVIVKSILLQAGPAGDKQTQNAAEFDAVWTTAALPETDYCAGLREQLAPKAAPGG